MTGRSEEEAKTIKIKEAVRAQKWESRIKKQTLQKLEY